MRFNAAFSDHNDLTAESNLYDNESTLIDRSSRVKLIFLKDAFNFFTSLTTKVHEMHASSSSRTRLLDDDCPFFISLTILTANVQALEEDGDITELSSAASSRSRVAGVGGGMDAA